MEEDDLFVELCDIGISEDTLFNEIKTSVMASMIHKLVETGKLGGFLEFAREQAKKDGMDSKELMSFFDELEKEYLFDDGINWNKVLDIVTKTTGCRVGGFKGDKCLIIENEELSDKECLDYINDENVAKIDLEHINEALETIDVKLEFIDALNLPVDVEGFQNIVRFRVVALD